MSSSDKKKQEPVFRLVCATIFDMEFDFEKIKEKVQYYCKGRETCPTTGRPHWQCFFYAAVGKRKTTWLKLLKPWHTEMCAGNLHQNESYCRKEGQWEEWGVKPMGDGKKRTLMVIKDQIDSGKRFKDIIREPDTFETCILYKNGLKEYESIVRTEAMYERGYLKKHVEIIVGPPDTLKTKQVFDEHPRVYRMPDAKLQWAGSYSGESVVLFDDVCHSNIMPIATFLHITDGYPLEVPIKGGFVAWTPTHVYFTSNEPFEQWWPDADAVHYAAATRRITKLTSTI